MRTITALIRSSFLCLAVAAAAAPAAEGDWAFGLRSNLLWSDGEPIGDIMAGGFTASREMDGWRLGMALDISSWDAEHPAETIGITQDPAFETVDAPVDETTLSVWMERQFGGDDDLRWVYTLGGGLSFTDVANAAGPVQGGGTFDIAIETGVEPFVLAGLGLRMPFGEGWELTSDFEARYRRMGWTLDDQNSASSGEIGNELLFGFSLGVTKRF